MTKASDNAFPSVLITEGTEPSAPAAGKQRLYIDSTSHKLKRTNSSGVDVDIEGLTNPMTTAGDVIYGGASGTPTRLAVGTAGQVLRTNSGATAPEWATASASHLWIGDPPAFAGSAANKDWRGAASLTPFTAVGSDGASTVVLGATTTTLNIYQFTASGLLLQCGNSENQEFRADYTLPDTQSMILAVSGGPHLQAGDNMQLALRLNDNDTSSRSGNYIAVGFEQDTTEYVVQGNSSIDSSGFEYTLRSAWLPPLVLFRIARAGLVYRSYASMNGGLTWSYVDTDTFGGALSNVWISFEGQTTGAGTMATARVPFIVEGHGDDAYDPW